MKECSDDIWLGDMFMDRPSIKEAVEKRALSRHMNNPRTLITLLRQIRNEQGAPSVVVIDNAHHLFKDQTNQRNTGVGASLALNLQERYEDSTITTIFLNSEDTIARKFDKCKSNKLDCA